MYIREVRQCGKNRVADIRHFFKTAKIPPIFRKNRKKILPHRWEVAACQKSLAEFAARRRQRNEIIFSRDMCVRENTARAASVEFVRHRRTNYARSRPQAFCRKNPEGFSTVSEGGVTTPRRPDLHHTPCKNPVIAKPVRTPAVAIRIPRPLEPLYAP